MSFRRILSTVLFAPLALFLPLQGQIQKQIFPSRANGNAVAANASIAAGAVTQAVSCANGICYHGGPVMLGAPTLYYIWYGNWAADPTAVGILSHFGQFDGGSPYYAINTTYYDSTNTHISNAINFGASYSDNYSLGKVLNDANIEQIVANAITGGHLPSDPNGIYFVLTWQDVQETTGFISQYCGWHTRASVNGVDIKFAFIGDANTQGLGACAWQTASSPNGDPAADAMASVIAHELEEAATDPDLNAWYDTQGEEVADKCEWTFGTTYRAGNGSLANMNLGGLDFLIQQDWVNASGGYCALMLPNGPTLTSISPGSGAPNTSVPVTIAGANLSGGTIGISGSGVTAANIVAAANQIAATFTIAAGAASGSRNVTVTTSAGTSNVLTFTVTSAPPTLSSITPSSGAAGSVVNITLAGSNLSGASFSPIAGVTIGNVSSSAAQVTATFTIAANASPGPQSLTVKTPGGTSNAVIFTINGATTTFSPIRINAGGGAYTDSQGNLWSADSNFNNGTPLSTTNVIAGTADQGLFQTLRQSPFVSPLIYTFKVPNGSYTVTLDFAEFHYTGPGQRVFNVSINGAVVLNNFDVFQTVGGNTALSETFPVTVTGGQIAIQFNGVKQNPIVNAIEILNSAGAPALTSIAPSSGVAGTAVNVTLGGTNLAGASINALAGITVGNVQATATQVTATLTIASTAAIGPRSVTVTTASGTSNPMTFTISSGASAFAPIRINAGGGAYTDTLGNHWSADSNFNGGSAQKTTNAIAGTPDPTLYQTFRLVPFTSPVTYTFTGIPNGSHTVTLGFAESGFTGAGQRLFNVSINGTPVLTNFDIYQTAGGNTATTQAFPITVTGGQIAIQFSAVKQDPIVNTIAIQ